MKKLSRMVILVLLPLLLANLIGCASIKLYPIEKQDIVIMKKGQSYAPDRDGYFLSQLYMDEILQAKVERIKSR
jgi:hypothetical protein